MPAKKDDTKKDEQELRESPVGQGVVADIAAGRAVSTEDEALARQKIEQDQHDAAVAAQARARDEEKAADKDADGPPRTRRSQEEKDAEQDDPYPTEQLQSPMMPGITVGTPNDNKKPVDTSNPPVGEQEDGTIFDPPHPHLYRKDGTFR